MPKNCPDACAVRRPKARKNNFLHVLYPLQVYVRPGTRKNNRAELQS